MELNKYDILETFDPDTNFWAVHPQLKVPKEFKNLYKADKSKDKTRSSNVMWAIAYVYHPKSKFYNLPIEQKKKLVAKDFLEDENFDWSSIEDEVNLFKELCLTQAERSLDNFYNKLKQRDEFINSYPYEFKRVHEGSSKTIAEALDSMLGKTKALYDTYYNILEELTKEDSGSKTEGGGVESLSDSGEI